MIRSDTGEGEKDQEVRRERERERERGRQGDRQTGRQAFRPHQSQVHFTCGDNDQELI